MMPEYRAGHPFAADHLQFILQYQDLDISRGGNMNLCNLDVLKTLWRSLHPDRKDFPLVSLVQHYFRDCHIFYIYQLKAGGAGPEDVIKKGFRPATVAKYWNDRKLAERIVGFKLPH